MKNFIQIIAIALVSFSNVVSASNGNLSNKTIVDDNIKKAKFVSYANPSLLKLELGTLTGYSKFNQVNIFQNNEIIEKEISISEVTFVSYADENLAEIELNSVILESESTNTAKVNYADANLINIELDFLKNNATSIDEKIKSNNSVIENKILNFKIPVVKKQSNTTNLNIKGNNKF